MCAIVEIPDSIREYIKSYEDIFFGENEFELVGRYITGLIISPNKTLQGIYDIQRWPDGNISRRSMHNKIFNGSWDYQEIMANHRSNVAADHQGNHGKEVIALDWTLGHHSRGKMIHGVHWQYDYAARHNSFSQLILTATISNSKLIDGLDFIVHEPSLEKKEKDYLNATAKNKEDYKKKEELYYRMSELLHFRVDQMKYKKRTEQFCEVVQKIEERGEFATANYAFDNGVLTVELTELIESYNKQWVSEVEKSRNFMFNGKYQRVDEIAKLLRTSNPESFRPYKVKQKNGNDKEYWAFTRVLKLKKYGKKRLVIAHENKELSDEPRFLITSGNHWESTKILDTWGYRWPIETFHEFAKQHLGLESAQVRNEKAVNNHLSLSFVSQSLVQRVQCSDSTSEKYSFANGKETFGRKCREITRKVYLSIFSFAEKCFKMGMSPNQVLENVMPA